jgi:hypothetical protein
LKASNTGKKVAELRAAMAEKVFSILWSESRNLTMQQAASCAVEEQLAKTKV